MDVVQLRARVGMVFQKPNPFPKSIYENVAYGPRIHGLAESKARARRDRREERCKRAGLWDEVKDRLQESGTALVGRPAAAPVHRPRHRRRSRSDPDGRALLGARPDRHRQDRGADPRAARPLRDRHRHPQHAAGRARVAAHRLLPPRRAGRIRQDRRRSSPIRASSAPRTTSPAATADRSKINAAGQRTYAQGVRRGHRTAARAHQPDGRARRACDRRGDALPRPARHRGRRAGRRGRQEARRARDRDRAPRGPADRAARADGRRPARRRRRAQDLRRGRAHRRLCQEHRQARAAARERGKIEPLSLLPEMARIATEMVHDVLDAFVERDAEAAVRVCERDGAVDDFYNSHLPRAAHPHDGKSAQHRPVGASAVRRQEPRAGRRPRHQHRRDGLFRGDRRAHGRPARARSPR